MTETTAHWSTFRLVGLAIGALTATISAWWLAADLPLTDPALAARIGYVRGRLWLRDGIALSSNSAAAPNEARAAFENAVALMPTNPEAWFALARAAERNDWVDQRASAALKMSYYTGFNVRSLVGPRLELLTRIDTTRAPELTDILKRELRLIVTRAPEFKSAIIASYRGAAPENRATIEQEITDLDPSLATDLRSAH